MLLCNGGKMNASGKNLTLSELMCYGKENNKNNLDSSLKGS